MFTSKREGSNLIVSTKNEEIIFTVPRDGTDLARITIEITVSNKYTANDIFSIRNKMMKDVLGVDSTHEEIEGGKGSDTHKKMSI